MKVCVVFGTRPEAIKLAPLVHQLRQSSVETAVVCTGQHKELIVPVLDFFDISPEVMLEVMRPGQSLEKLTAALVESLGDVFQKLGSTHVFVQGDTTTAFVGALVGFYQRRWVGHVEAGLRTRSVKSPFPEEANRRFVSVVADRHYAPTERAAENLKQEGVDAGDIVVTGNTVVDALRWVQENRKAELALTLAGDGVANKKFILATLHRRENIGQPLDAVLGALKSFLAERPEWTLVLPLHKNPAVRTQILAALDGCPGVLLLEAQGYPEFCGLMQSCSFIVTDSGGIQEEAPYLNKRTIVVREATERPEGLLVGTSWLAGTDEQKVLSLVRQAAAEIDAGRSPELRHINPFGDGTATVKIVGDLLQSHA